MEEVTVTGGAGVVEIGGGVIRPELPAHLRIALATGQLRRPLRDTLRPLLILLADGDYRLSDPAGAPAGLELVSTDVWPPADAARAAYYRTAIRAGHRPVALALQTTPATAHILDGHHKIAAYQAEGLAPVVLLVVRTAQAYSDS